MCALKLYCRSSFWCWQDWWVIGGQPYLHTYWWCLFCWKREWHCKVYHHFPLLLTRRSQYSGCKTSNRAFTYISHATLPLIHSVYSWTTCSVMVYMYVNNKGKDPSCGKTESCWIMLLQPELPSSATQFNRRQRRVRNWEDPMPLRLSICMYSMYLIQWKGYLAKEDSWIAEQELKHVKSALEDYKKLHPSVFSPQSSPAIHKTIHQTL